MVRRVLVPLDQTTRAEKAIDGLPNILSPGDEVVLVSVGVPQQRLQTGIRPGRIIRGEMHGSSGGSMGEVIPDRPIYGETTDQAIQGQLDELSDYLRSKMPALQAQGYKVELAVEISDEPALAIIDLARRSNATFILMVRTTHRSVGERLFGTVARRIIDENVAPVMILPDATDS